jgi:hypothetical protein
MHKSEDETVILELECHAATSKAVLLSDDGEEDNAVWIPKSQIVSGGHREKGESGEFEIKEWIAVQKGLI